MDIDISEVSESDLPAIVGLLNEVDKFYEGEVIERPEERSDRVASVLFGENRSVRVLVARADGGRVVGFASFSFLWPAAGSSRSLYLKELYITGDYRKLGIGGELMQAVFNVAEKAGCSRVEWTTDTSNLDAQRFYEKLGESASSSKIFYRHETA